MKRRRVGLGLLVATLAVVTAACGVPSTDGPEPLPSELAELAPQPQDSAVVAAETVDTDLAWVKGDRIRLAPREVTATDVASQASAALEAVIAGPTDAEQALGLSTEVRPDLVASLLIEGDGAIIDLQSGSSPGDATLATAQLALSVLLVPGVESVTFTIAGRPAEVPRADGKVRSGPVTVDDYASLVRARQLALRETPGTTSG
ncbi:MAG: GerMN domain-containing protein [Actinomycetota bacterium]|nr:GerMN domain-containing protein [Actinomycetota bacterium]MDH4352659.1 GerMN domain-containing protein [Actinomycetota bacterium]MDH5277627.1 GerMN domain-containing protein [Actinomycetota bacterium]